MQIPQFQKEITIGITNENKVKYIKDLKKADITNYKKIITKTINEQTFKKIYDYYKLTHDTIHNHDDFNQYLAQSIYNDPDYIDDLKGD